jgi:hypothetical protein
MFMSDDNNSLDLWDNFRQQFQPNHTNAAGPQNQGAFNPGSSNNLSPVNAWAALRKKAQQFKWGGPDYDVAQDLMSAGRGRFDFDPTPSNTSPFLSSAAWGDRELDRQGAGYYSAAYDPTYQPLYNPETQVNYNPFQSTSADTFFSPYKQIMY